MMKTEGVVLEPYNKSLVEFLMGLNRVKYNRWYKFSLTFQKGESDILMSGISLIELKKREDD